jgi:transcriptional regulator with XRE-family HTH domain
MITLGEALKQLRKRLGMSQRDFANQIGFTPQHVCNVEHNVAAAGPLLIEAIQGRFDIDLHVYAWACSKDVSRLPKKMQKCALELAELWDEQIEAVLKRRAAT